MTLSSNRGQMVIGLAAAFSTVLGLYSLHLSKKMRAAQIQAQENSNYALISYYPLELAAWNTYRLYAQGLAPTGGTGSKADRKVMSVTTLAPVPAAAPTHYDSYDDGTPVASAATTAVAPAVATTAGKAVRGLEQWREVKGTSTFYCGSSETVGDKRGKLCVSDVPPPVVVTANLEACTGLNVGCAATQDIDRGTKLYLRWSSTNATSCSLAPVGWTGTSGNAQTANLINPITYTLTCNNGTESGTDSAAVTIRGGWYAAWAQNCTAFCASQAMTNQMSPDPGLLVPWNGWHYLYGSSCASGEVITVSAYNAFTAGLITFPAGCWGGCAIKVIHRGISFGGRCYGQGVDGPFQIHDNDSTDTTTACYCRR